ncbi:TadE/TadG family type IV pilus assembly protein [Aurantiacibacter sediminis]|uniref:Pilus assembly protein n=1 Tax=Aurantiacibacter sediminis TaxID=2793064 RepID=A0ABS0N1N2_9SPHN|nr:TadE/TadG family type IV pilus assembly protein [Aurantiacibacter sediminis]MBH5321878.1 pilus assembly protein [Aurantiacibacter sediminis]
MMSIPNTIKAAKAFLSDLREERSGLAMVEFAFAAPLILTLGLGGMELANLAATQMRISQTAMQVADNASRIGDRNALSAQKIYESDILDLLIGAEILAGSSVDIYESGRIIVSSLEENDDGGQTIAWQRCMGKLNRPSAYGDEGTGETGTGFAGMGIEGQELTAPSNGAVMYVEIIYTYEPLVTAQIIEPFTGGPDLRSEAAFTVRGSRDLSQIYDDLDGETGADCSRFGELP